MHTTFIQPFVHHSYCLKTICDDRTSSGKHGARFRFLQTAAQAKTLAAVVAGAKAVRPAQVALGGSSVGTSVDGALDGVSPDSGTGNAGDSYGEGKLGAGSGGRWGWQVAVTVLKYAVHPCSAPLP